MIERLRAAVGPERVITDPDRLAPHETDWTGRWGGPASAMVRPTDTAGVAAVVTACRATGTALVAQGGNTGLVGGGVPRGGEVLLSSAALRLGPHVDPVRGQVLAGAGVTLGEVQRAASAAGWRYPVDLSARDSATIGGTVATNAGGNHVLAHGMTRRHVLGIEAVLGTGDVVSHLGGLVKDNTGYDLPGLLCGSEGTLGIVTVVCLALVTPPEETAVAVVGVDDLATAVAVTAQARRELPGIEAAEVVLADGSVLVQEAFALAPVLAPEPPVTLLLEVAGPAGAAERLASFLAGVEGLGGSAVAEDAAGRAALWRIREDHNPAINRLGPPHKYDVSLPADDLDAVVGAARERVAALAPTARLWVFGHIGDGNLHLNVSGLDPDDERVDEAVLGLVAEAGGSISAEHGIGVAKARWLPLARSPEEIRAFGAIKAALDPDGILNPGVLL